MVRRIYTTHFEKILEEEFATQMYFFLQENIHWEEGIRSKKGFTRMASPVSFTILPSEIQKSFVDAVRNYCDKKQIYGVDDITISGTYLNYYVDGNNWCPNHTHPGSIQAVLSLGTMRTLKVGNKNYEINNGDMILFGSSTHGIQKEKVDMTNIFSGGRISIAVFIEPF